MIKIQKEPILRTIWGPCFCHREQCFGHFWERGLQDKPTKAKFGMEHHWAQWLRFRKNQLEGPCFSNKRAVFWPFLGKGATGYTQQCQILHGTSLGTLIKIQEEPMIRTMWGPCIGHKRAMFLPFLGKGATGYTQKCEIWHGTSVGILIKIQEEPIRMTMCGPCFGHKRVMFWPFLVKGAIG